VSGEGHRIDYRSDIFSLGAVMYELLTGVKPFVGDTHAEVAECIVKLPVKPPAECDATIPLELERICLRALAKRASDRYDAAFDLAEDLRHWAARSDVSVAVNLPRIVPKGLRSYDASDHSFFLSLLPGPHDRDGLPDSLRFWKTRIESTDAQRSFRVGVVYGPSGCGKSSLIKAGLLPRLADHVQRVLVEATPDQTEEQLLRAVRKLDVDLPQNLPLVATLQQFCRSKDAQPQPQKQKQSQSQPQPQRQSQSQSQKLLIVIDQFEQWLHGNAGQADTALSRALRLCDGERLQVLLLVRDDFWMPITRLFKEIQVSLVETQNARPVDLFDPLHARHVLSEFGRAYGRLPEQPRRLVDLENTFLDQAIAALANQGQIISVQLALFAHMMKGRLWQPQTLQELGGMVGVGQMFLEETFCSPLAPPRHRQHQAAARAILQTLLPDNGSDIKGQRRTVDELCSVSGQAAKSSGFQELLALLDGELRLVTPVMSDGVITSYQLTHDYLVPVLRDWLMRKQQEHRRGRAELRLQERAVIWRRRPEQRYLPSFVEFLSIWLWTDRRQWKTSECGMMAKAGRFYAIRTALGMLLLLIALGAGLIFRHRVHQQQEAIRLQTLTARLVTAEPEQLAVIIDELQRSPKEAEVWLSPLLAQQVQSPEEKRAQLHARMAIVARNPALVAPLIDDLLTGDVRYVAPIGRQLQPWMSTWTETLRQCLHDEQADSARRTRAALALIHQAGKDEVNNWTESELQVIARQLVRERIEHQLPMRKIMRPVQERLVPRLQEINESTTCSDDERLSAANALVDYAEDDPVVMGRLVAEASTAQYEAIYTSVKPLVTDELLGELSRIAATSPPPELKAEERVRFGGRRANAAIALLQLGKFTAAAAALHSTDDPESLTQFTIRCRASGVQSHSLIDGLDAVSALPIDRSSNHARYTLMLALGDYPWQEIPVDRRAALVQRLAYWYANDPSASVHSAAGWLLRQWEQTKLADRVDQT
ncbi:MAG: serine/threonine protein kinase, partial [Planctomycetota bacterium]